MDEEKIRQAFSKAKKDIFSLKFQLTEIQSEIQEIKRTLDRQSDSQTDRHINQTQDNQTSTHNFSSTYNLPLEALKPQNTHFSTGNRGVSTDRQTLRQTDRHTQKFALNQESAQPKDMAHLVDSLTTIKSELKQKFKSLTKQEFLVFSLIYQLEEEGNTVDYSLLSDKLSLTESSARDYVQRMIKKQIPIVKTRENNKRILLTISPELKKLLTLSTILQIRDSKA